MVYGQREANRFLMAGGYSLLNEKESKYFQYNPEEGSQHIQQ